MQPASPTLSNPALILPEEYTWTIPTDLDHVAFSFDTASSSSASATATPVTPVTPIIYGNGTCLSDIGEVTEAESLPARKLPNPAERRAWKQQQQQHQNQQHHQNHQHHHHHHQQHKPPSHAVVKSSSHERKVSEESTSTVTSRGHIALLQDVDDLVSVDGSACMGDDEHSLADSYTEGLIASETRRLAERERDDDDRNASAALSRRAEHILQTAKRRLDVSGIRASWLVMHAKQIHF